MGDAFDEFMRELERRRRQAMGEDPDADPDPDPDEPGGRRGPIPLDDQPRAGRVARDDRGAGRSGGGPGAPGGSGGGSGGAGDAGAAGRGRGPSPRQPGVRGFMRRYAIAIIGVAVLVVLFLAGTFLDLWTDAIWYRSVGFDGVFFARLGAQLQLFLVGLVVAGVFLLGNLWLARRLIPRMTVGPGPLRGWAERLADATAQGASVGRAREARGRDERAGPIFVFDGGDIPDFTPLAGWVLTGFAILVTFGIAIALAADWEQVLLWQHRVPFSPTASVTDPIFGRDISFFLFELPFWRTLQTIANGLLFTALVLAGGRYAVAASRGGGVFTVPVRLHLGILPRCSSRPSRSASSSTSWSWRTDRTGRSQVCPTPTPTPGSSPTTC